MKEPAPACRQMTRDEFRTATGRWPEHDDLERVNCPDAGTLGHRGCGWCKWSDRPSAECLDCIGGYRHPTSVTFNSMALKAIETHWLTGLLKALPHPLPGWRP